MTEVTNHLYDTIDEQNSGLPASTRRSLVKTTAAALGSMGMLGLVADNAFGQVKTADENSVANITTVAATAEVLATIVNTVGAEKLASQLDATTLRNVRAAAQQEKNHYELLTSSAVGGKAATTSIHVPDEVFVKPDRAADHARRRRPGVHQRLPAGQHRVRAPRHAEGLEVRPLHRRDHGRRGRAPRARPAVPGQARQRPRVPKFAQREAVSGPADDRRARLLQDHGRRRDPRVRRLRLRQGRQQAGADLRVRHRGRRARRPTRT